MRIAIYTCLVGDYDNIAQPLSIDERYDYICFSDSIKENSIGIWEIREIPFKCKDKTRLSRYVKLLPHRVLADYDYSIYIDANITIRDKEFYRRIENSISKGSLIAQVNHPFWDCVYEDIYHAYRLSKVSFVSAYRQYRHLKKEGMPRHYGLFENNIIFRKHNDPLVKHISEEWWREYMRYSKRDQFSLMYIYWKNSYMPDLLLGKDECARNVDFLDYYYHVVKTFNQKIASGHHVSYYERLKNVCHRISYMETLLGAS